VRNDQNFTYLEVFQLVSHLNEFLAPNSKEGVENRLGKKGSVSPRNRTPFSKLLDSRMRQVRGSIEFFDGGGTRWCGKVDRL